ncbi:MAG: SDR family NAD(P)-dependent oxidoreductase [Oscillospiraceae bacterium]
MELGLKDKVVVITGGSQGIGKAAALEFAREGCRVCVCARRQAKLDATKAEFKALGFDLFTRAVDVTKYGELEQFANEITNEFGHIDVWVNNAGVNQYKFLIDYDVDDFKRIIDTNLTAVFMGAKIAALHMKNSGGGVILNCSSYSAVTPIAGKAPYAAAKTGVLSLTKTMAAEFAPYNIRVVAYIPGLIRTEISKENIDRFGDSMLRDIPMKRYGEPEDLAKSLVFLASDCAGYIDGVSVEISGAKRCVQNPWYPYDAQ